MINFSLLVFCRISIKYGLFTFIKVQMKIYDYKNLKWFTQILCRHGCFVVDIVIVPCCHPLLTWIQNLMMRNNRKTYMRNIKKRKKKKKKKKMINMYDTSVALHACYHLNRMDSVAHETNFSMKNLQDFVQEFAGVRTRICRTSYKNLQEFVQEFAGLRTTYNYSKPSNSVL